MDVIYLSIFILSIFYFITKICGVFFCLFAHLFVLICNGTCRFFCAYFNQEFCCVFVCILICNATCEMQFFVGFFNQNFCWFFFFFFKIFNATCGFFVLNLRKTTCGNCKHLRESTRSLGAVLTFDMHKWKSDSSGFSLSASCSYLRVECCGVSRLFFQQ